MNKEEQIQAFDHLVSIARETLIAKGDDYAGSDRLSNFKDAGAIVGINPQQQVLSLIATKVARLGNLYNTQRAPNNESIRDSILDLFVYSSLLYMVEKELYMKEHETFESSINEPVIIGMKS